MTIQNTNQRAPLSAQQGTGPDGVFASRLEIRTLDGHVGTRLKGWIHDRLGRQLGKFAPQIERIEVRFDDVNGTKGGVDRTCMVHIVLSALPPVIVEMVGASDHEAFDLAAGRAERATRRNLEKHGFSTGHKRRHRGAEKDQAAGAGNGQALQDEVDAGLDTAGLVDGDGGNGLDGSVREPHPHLKDSPGLTLRTMNAVQSPEAKAFRNRTARH